MGDYSKHIAIAKEKLESLYDAVKNKRNTIIGDLAIKITEQLVEADLARQNKHLTNHFERHQYINKTYPKEIQTATRKAWYAYKDLGYDGLNGKRAEIVMHNMVKILKYFEAKLNERFIAEN